jgi:RNA polymerase sigma factor (TIGR02999 family)
MGASMADSAASPVTQVLARFGPDGGPTDELIPLVYAELRALARAWMAREPAGHTLPPTALVHEAYLRLVTDPSMQWENRRHFFGAAAEAMRRILIERARRVARQKRGGDRSRVEFDEGRLPDAAPQVDEVLAIHDALDELVARDADMAQVVKLRYFGGLTVEETAQALDQSPRSVNRSWTAARAWLKVRLEQGSR